MSKDLIDLFRFVRDVPQDSVLSQPFRLSIRYVTSNGRRRSLTFHVGAERPPREKRWHTLRRWYTTLNAATRTSAR